MARRRKIVVMIEQEEVRLTLPRGATQRAWCGACGREREMILAEAAVLVSGRSLRTLLREVEAGERHFAETADGLVLLCPERLGLDPSPT